MKVFNDIVFEKALRKQMAKYGTGIMTCDDFIKFGTFMYKKLLEIKTINPAYVYAYCVTGLMPIDFGDGNTNLINRSKKDKAEWNDAYEDYELAVELDDPGILDF